MIARLGKEIDDPDSVYYWAYKVITGCAIELTVHHVHTKDWLIDMHCACIVHALVL